MADMGSRGLLVVVEGLDRSGKTTQCQRLYDALQSSGSRVKYQKFPDRTTLTGQMINGYLTNQAQQDDHSIHLLFSANRWEAIKELKALIDSGTNIVVDRYSFSGAVYSAAKENPDLSLEWAWSPEIGLPQPDIALFLDISSEDAAKRGGYGEERYETERMQTKVRALFRHLFARLPGLNVHFVNAGQDLDQVTSDITIALETSLPTIDLDKPLARLKALANEPS